MAEGCGEQRMRKFATTIMARRYLDETLQSTKEDKKKFDNILAQSYQEVMSLQNSDGSFDLWGTNKVTDLWKSLYNSGSDYLDLTAYIVKLLAQYEAIKALPDKAALHSAMRYIQDQQKSDGRFQNNGKPQFRDLERYSEIEGVLLTEYVLIGILESEYLKANYIPIVEKGLRFIERKYEDILHGGTNYERALTLYLYVLAGKDHQTMLNKLSENAVRSQGNVYWELKPRTSSSPAVQVEIASYVALSLIKLQNFDEAMKVVKFLMTKRNPKGGFESTTDTVLGWYS